MDKRNRSVVSTGKRSRSITEMPVTSLLKDGDIPTTDDEGVWSPDEEVLAALGYKVSKLYPLTAK